MKEKKDDDKGFFNILTFLLVFGMMFYFLLTICSFLDIDPRENTGNILGIDMTLSVLITLLAMKLREIIAYLEVVKAQNEEILKGMKDE